MSVYSGVSANISCGKLKLSSSSCETFRFEFFGLLACPIYFMLIFLCLLSLAAFYSHLAMTCQACRRLISSHGDDYNKIFAFFFFFNSPESTLLPEECVRRVWAEVPPCCLHSDLAQYSFGESPSSRFLLRNYSFFSPTTWYSCDTNISNNLLLPAQCQSQLFYTEMFKGSMRTLVKCCHFMEI